MAIFAILTQGYSPHLRANIETTYRGRHRHWSDEISFVAGAGTARTVAEGLGIKTIGQDGGATAGIDKAIVIEVAPSYWGWTDAAFWSWLTNAFQESIDASTPL